MLDALEVSFEYRQDTLDITETDAVLHFGGRSTVRMLIINCAAITRRGIRSSRREAFHCKHALGTHQLKRCGRKQGQKMVQLSDGRRWSGTEAVHGVRAIQIPKTVYGKSKSAPGELCEFTPQALYHQKATGYSKEITL